MNEAGNFTISEKGTERFLGLAYKPHCPVKFEQLTGRRLRVGKAHVSFPSRRRGRRALRANSARDLLDKF